jgi:hypothetical protein
MIIDDKIDALDTMYPSYAFICNDKCFFSVWEIFILSFGGNGTFFLIEQKGRLFFFFGKSFLFWEYCFFVW